ncbi:MULTISPECIES: hypothetical protein [unclassified Mesorhizobium]|uniref:hypothetical protein n=1 Tax=unclassified Mesorhizobium TaxID=325217 RepID=UPI0011269F14|nr:MULTISPECIES: hypothetical protein [unclassified Mesorhizobium]TPK51384.1 hypothetical protein FJ550_15535 [Mesorhizobium sp. B2-5-2]TPL19845.1 hypothetical protein FJ945_23200 [Mesorhizobium sp. B2-4-9]TPL30339.1 hypothetical protein FJ946_03505 [Mesorhizobium sp. B2-4-7]TPL44658.1 hypothetical protein FJ961_04830 [Mesorhizobium sp. B2-4-5]TPM76077.1 hypothetical protein FJ968_06665 [Mesorhizobium sp. B2-1-6]
MSVRIWGTLGVTLAAMAGGAQASSLVFPGAPSATPSIVALKAADAAQAGDTRSVTELGDPDVTYEKVAAIPNAPEARHGFLQNPTIIRGGIVGSAFSTPTQAKAPATAPATATASAAPAANGQKIPATSPAAAPAAAAQQPVPGVGKLK